MGDGRIERVMLIGRKALVEPTWRGTEGPASLFMSRDPDPEPGRTPDSWWHSRATPMPGGTDS
jgi:hypothetical protein